MELHRSIWTLVSALMVLLPCGSAIFFPIFLPFSVKITVHTGHKPAPPVSIHYDPDPGAPVYKEVVIKPSGHSHKQSYGNGHDKGTSYGDGKHKIYVTEPHIKGHKYASGYGSKPPQGSYAPPTHYKGTEYGSVPDDSDYDKDYPPPTSHVAVPGNSYAEISTAHAASKYPKHHKGYDPTLTNYKVHTHYDDPDDEHSASYLDDSNTGHTDVDLYHHGPVATPLRYAGFGSTFYGDSYAKISYSPKLKVSISATVH